MKNDSGPIIPLISQGEDVCYRRHPTNPVFECCLHPGMTLHLGTDPATVLSTPRNPKNFWLQVLVHVINAGGQIVFETSPPRQANDTQIEVAARTLFQIDGDILVKIDNRLLTRTDCIEILEAHFGWTDWCLQQLGHALSLPVILRYIGWLSLIIGVLLFPLGVKYDCTVLQALGIGMLMPGHLLLPPAILRRLQWLPPLLGVYPILSGLLLHEAGMWGVLIVALIGILSGPVGRRLLPPLAWKVAGCIIRRRIDRLLSNEELL